MNLSDESYGQADNFDGYELNKDFHIDPSNVFILSKNSFSYLNVFARIKKKYIFICRDYHRLMYVF